MGVSESTKRGLGGFVGDKKDFNDIKNKDEKKGVEWGKTKASFQDFRGFISNVGMGDIKFRGEAYTWANNREGEGFIQERLDRFCGSTKWML